MRDQKPKKHHYVPQFILRNFSVRRKRRIYVFDKFRSCVITSNVLDVGHENYFYRDEKFDYNDSTEGKLASLEGKCATIFEKVVSRENVGDLTVYERTLVSLFTAVQLIRTKSMREFLSEFNRNISDWIKSIGFDPNRDVENFQDMSESDIKSSSIHVLNTLPCELAQHLIDKELVLLKCPKGESFYISDNPVVMHNNFPKAGRGNLGLRLHGIEVHFPISPRLCVAFICSKMISEIRDQVREHNVRISFGTAFPVDLSEAERMVTDIDKGVALLLQPENVEFYNSLQVIHSSRFVYSKNEVFALAKNMLRTNPELKEPAELTANHYTF